MPRVKKAIAVNGYKYYYSSIRKDMQYFICEFSKKRFFCKAMAKLPVTETDSEHLIILSPHNHEPDDLKEMEECFKEQLKQYALKSPLAPKQVFDVVSLLYPEAAVRVGYKNVESTIRHWRKTTVPPIPQTLAIYGEMMENPDWTRYSTMEDGPFYLGTVTARDGSQSVILGNISFLNKILTLNQHINVDATFKCVPNVPHFYQVLIILGSAHGQALPILFALMERKSQELYKSVFIFLKEKISTDTSYPRTVMCDYELGLYRSISATFQDATVQGCHFHYSQAVFRKAKSLGIIQQISGNNSGVDTLRMYLALPLLPENSMEEGMNFIKSQTPADLVAVFERFEEYINRQWISKVGAAHFSVFNSRQRTNNNLESFNRRLNVDVGTENPAFWTLHATLKKILSTAMLNFERLSNGLPITRNQRPEQIKYEKRLFEAWRKLEDKLINTAEFLTQAKHFVANMHGQLQQFHSIGDDEEDNLVNFQDLSISNEVAAEGENDSLVDESIFNLPEDDFEPAPEEAFLPDNEEDDIVVRWECPFPNEDDEDVPQYLRCGVCLSHKKQFTLECGHIYCGECAATVFNKLLAKCPDCRILLLEEPKRVFL